MRRTSALFVLCLAFSLATAAAFPPPAMPLEWGACPAEWMVPPAPPTNPWWSYDVEAASAVFLAPAAALQSTLPTTELPILEAAPGVGLVIIGFYRHRQPWGIEPYNELAVYIPVLDPSLLAGYTPGYMLYLPVTTEEAMTGGIQGWGFPKTLAKIKCHDDSREGSPGITCMAKANGLEILTLELNTGNLVPGASIQPLAFTVKKDLLVKTNMAIIGDTFVGTDFGGAKLILGDHPIGRHLQALGVSPVSIQHSWIPSMQMGLYFPYACAPLH